ncbi:deoxyribodipyrimidine photo-lyase [Thalassovita sp.]|uniref:cryptochrome/photolyase family protein n=1 Tax=Thalassovita sp. TaxID=1979401 RepID=UPI0029DE6B28|nr:deoxyribodipyrimidine photo-lyase [Thalassovita sp.]
MRKPVLLWLRRDLRLRDHWALDAAIRRGGPVIPVFVRDSAVDRLGAAPAWRLGLGLGHFAQELENRGSRLILCSGPAAEVLADLVRETGAGAVVWTRGHDPVAVAQGRAVKQALQAQGAEAQSCGGFLLFEPQGVQTGAGGPYRVFTPFWKAVRGREVAECLPAPSRIPAPDVWPDSDSLPDWRLGAGMRRGAEVVRPHVRLGEAAALARLEDFVAEGIGRYGDLRDLPGVDGTSGLSENLALGEISPHRCWHAGWRAMQAGSAGAEIFLKELVWREFAYHLAFHTPHLLTGCWRPEWDGFGWQTEADHPHVVAWQRGRTGVPFVDAAMREMYVTGRMHNRARMIVASFLTKHLLTDWRIGRDWFADCLIDWDPASNAMGWQWVAGCGPDAAPYFRVFNPVTQQAKFDPQGAYVRRWVAEGQRGAPDSALDYFRAIPGRWGLSADDPYPAPVVTPDAGRKRALAAYENRGF